MRTKLEVVASREDSCEVWVWQVSTSEQSPLVKGISSINITNSLCGVGVFFH